MSTPSPSGGSGLSLHSNTSEAAVPSDTLSGQTACTDDSFNMRRVASRLSVQAMPKMTWPTDFHSAEPCRRESSANGRELTASPPDAGRRTGGMNVGDRPSRRVSPAQQYE